MTRSAMLCPWVCFIWYIKGEVHYGMGSFPRFDHLTPTYFNLLTLCSIPSFYSWVGFLYGLFYLHCSSCLCHFLIPESLSQVSCYINNTNFNTYIPSLSCLGAFYVLSLWTILLRNPPSIPMDAFGLLHIQIAWSLWKWGQIPLHFNSPSPRSTSVPSSAS